MDEKNKTSYGSGAGNTEEPKSQEKPKLVKIPVEEALFEFDGFEFEEIKRSGSGANTSSSAESKADQVSKLEENLKKDADLVVKLSELHGIPAKGNTAENKAEEKSDVSEEEKTETTEEDTSVASEVSEAETEDEQNTSSENEEDNEASVEPEAVESKEKIDGSYEADPEISNDEAYKAYSETVEEVTVAPKKSDETENEGPQEAEEKEQTEAEEVVEETPVAEEESKAEEETKAEEEMKAEEETKIAEATESEESEEEAQEESEETEASENTEESEEAEAGETAEEIELAEEAAEEKAEEEKAEASAEIATDEAEAEENAEAEEPEAEEKAEEAVTENDEAEVPAEATESENSEEEAPAETAAYTEAESDDQEETAEDESPATALPIQSQEEKDHMTAQINASFTGKADEGDSRQVTFLDIINGDSESEENATEEPKAEEIAEASEETEKTAENAENALKTEESAETSETEPAAESIVEEPIAPESEEAQPEEPEQANEVNEAEEAEAEEAEETEKAPESDEIWDEADREMVAAKKRYLEYCKNLTVPPLRITKDTAVEINAEQESQTGTVGSGYQYEMVERLPLFADGIHGGKETEGYRERERQYCDNREEKKRAHLGNKARSYCRRSIFAAVLMLTLLVFENLNLFFGKSPDLLLTGENVIVFATIEIAMLMIGAILIFDSIIDGITAIFKGMIIPETLSAGLTFAAIAYHVGLLAYPELPEKAVLLGSPVALAMLLTLMYKYNMTNSAITAFGIASSYGEYTTEVKIKDLRNTPDGRAFKGMVPKSAKLYKMNKVARIDGCYTSRPTRDECFGILRKLALIVFGAAVVSGLAFGLIMSSVYYGVLGAYLMLMLGSPIGIFISLYYPRIRCAKAAADEGAAVIGYDDESDEFEKAVIMIDDGEIFPANDLKIVEFVVSQTPDMEMQLSRVCGLFTKMGGPVDKVFKNMKPGLHECESIEFVEISEKGICAMIDGRTIVAGSESYLVKHGAAVERYDHPMAQNARVMYIAENGEFIARIVMEFKADAELCARLAKHRHTATVFALKTCNPCIDEDLVFETTGIEPDFLKVVKYNAGDDVMPLETDREGILVSRTGLKGLLAAMLEYKRQKRLVYLGCKFSIVSCIIGGVVALMLTAIGNAIGYISLASMTIAGALTLFSAFAASRSAINTKSKKKKD